MTTQTRTCNVGIYVRISDDRDGTQTATKRQLEDCRRFAASKGWHVADVFEDVDTSAYQRTSKRPEFERMMGALRDGAIDGVLVWKIDRLSRRQRDLVRVDEQCEESGGFIA
ncbi:MAG: recombinase family protein, partial [Chloroflexi bacterium]|nr:recombinase family protein [Chloroflexota bacterium]